MTSRRHGKALGLQVPGARVIPLVAESDEILPMLLIGVIADTGCANHFPDAGDRFGRFDLGFIKIGAYARGAAWLDVPMSAEDAVRAQVGLLTPRVGLVVNANERLRSAPWWEVVR